MLCIPSLHEFETEHKHEQLLLEIGNSLVVIVNSLFSEFSSLQHVVVASVTVCSSLPPHFGFPSASEANNSELKMKFQLRFVLYFIPSLHELGSEHVHSVGYSLVVIVNLLFSDFLSLQSVVVVVSIMVFSSLQILL